MSKLQTVHVRINDLSTGKPTPVRVRFTDAEGTYYAPFGRLTSFTTTPGLGVGGNVLIESQPWAYIDGACEIDLPPGQVRVQVAKGPEYNPIDQWTVILAGRLSLRMNIERRANLRQDGWYSGEVQSHFLSPQAALLEGQAEDLAVVNVLIAPGYAGPSTGQEPSWLGSILEFSGQHPAAQAPEALVAVNSLNYSCLGTLALLHCHRVVYPLRAGIPLNWTLADWCGQCHRKGGLVLWCHFDDRPADYLCTVWEGLADLILGEVDALQTTSLIWCRGGQDLWYALLNSGFRVPMAAGSGKDSNQTPLGQPRTYVRLHPGKDLTLASWIEGLRAGQTFVTNGPLLTFAVEGQQAGETVRIPQGQDRVKISAKVLSLEPLERLQIIGEGKVLAEMPVEGMDASLDQYIAVGRSTWLAARCFGPSHGQSPPFPAAHTSPVYVHRGDEPFHPRAEALELVESHLQPYSDVVDPEKGIVFASPQDRERLSKIFQTALQTLRARKTQAS